MVKVFPKPEDAEKWAVEVMGDMVITQIHPDQEVETIVAEGMVKKAGELSNEIQDALSRAVETGEYGDSIKYTSFTLLPSIVQALQDIPVSRRGAVITRLSEEIAYSEISQRYTLIKEIVNAGLRSSVISMSPFANSMIPFVKDNALALLNGDSEDLNEWFQMRMSGLMTGTALRILEQEADGQTEDFGVDGKKNESSGLLDNEGFL